MVSGVWSVVCGQWCVVSGVRSVKRGQWCVVSDVWSVVCGQCKYQIKMGLVVESHWNEIKFILC